MNRGNHSERQHNARRAISRRTALQIGGAALATMVAGCNQLGGQRSPQATQKPAQQSDRIEALRFEGQDMVVELADDHDVSAVNLIAPDGTLYAGESVEFGVSAARLSILDPDLATGDYDHYSPGDYEIALETRNGTQSVPFELNPSLEIIDVYQYQESDSAENLGQIGVEVANRGSGPTWIYDISFEDAPYFGANGEVRDNPGVVLLKKPTDAEQLILYPDESRKYVSSDNPLFFDRDNQDCPESLEMTVVAGIATGDTISERVEVGGNGSSIGIPSGDRVVCEDLVIQKGGAE